MSYYLIALVLGLLVLIKRKVNGKTNPYNSTNMKGKIVLITGANGGIGETAALGLARMGARLVLGCRDMNKAESAAERIRSETGAQVEVLPLDLSDLNSVRSFCAAVRVRVPRIDALVNNAGVFMTTRQLSAQGFEMHFATNHLGPFLLTRELMVLLRAADKARIVNVSSEAHKHCKLRLDDLQLEQGFRSFPAYAQSKLLNVLFTAELARRLADTGVTALSLHPGVVRTDITRYLFANNALIRAATVLLFPLFWLATKSSWQGAQTTLYAVTAPELEGRGGAYLCDCREEPCSAPGRDEALARQLWDLTEKLLA